VKHIDFGLIAAAYSTAQKIGLVDILNKHIQGNRFNTKRATFFLIAILNRIDNATSKEKMGDRAQKTIIPKLLSINPKNLNSKTFWYVTDDIISEKELTERRKEEPAVKDEMQLMAKNAGLEMSPAVLKQELKDLKVITWVDGNMRIHSKVSAKSTIQKKLYHLFGIEKIEKMLTIQTNYHN